MSSAIKFDSDKRILSKASFNPLLKTYLFLHVLGILLISFIGVIIIPFWIMGVGFLICRKYFENIECILTERTLEYKKGYLLRTEKTVLLDKIQDLTLKEGPLLRALGLTALVIETAGQSQPQGSGDARLIGIIEPRQFRNEVLTQRDKLVEKLEARNQESGQAPVESHLGVLEEIRNTLQRIEKLLDKDRN
jgi:putative membrane protein